MHDTPGAARMIVVNTVVEAGQKSIDTYMNKECGRECRIRLTYTRTAPNARCVRRRVTRPARQFNVLPRFFPASLPGKLHSMFGLQPPGRRSRGDPRFENGVMVSFAEKGFPGPTRSRSPDESVSVVWFRPKVAVRCSATLTAPGKGVWSRLNLLGNSPSGTHHESGPEIRRGNWIS